MSAQLINESLNVEFNCDFFCKFHYFYCIRKCVESINHLHENNFSIRKSLDVHHLKVFQLSPFNHFLLKQNLSKFFFLGKRKRRKKYLFHFL